ncbi:hypothetical protein IGI04_014763 [Brassica rapa subsp. trilocularis]|uniref:Zinc finger GRF-type domain-containing protein n=1 Tax=Brassica rapa subsp. trilocularis TaxID=1813537 RepID=A0ABQ7MN39_BRACM|nr:hypothetical protein IGI04_014763 [Brassica rapa subsp. trilocularis]
MTHPDKEYRQMKAWKRDTNMLGCVADAECGIPTRCPCGGTIINEVSRNLKYPTDFDTLPGRKYFTCKNYEEEVEMLRKRVDAMAAEIAELKYNLTRQNPTTP